MVGKEVLRVRRIAVPILFVLAGLAHAAYSIKILYTYELDVQEFFILNEFAYFVGFLALGTLLTERFERQVPLRILALLVIIMGAARTLVYSVDGVLGWDSPAFLVEANSWILDVFPDPETLMIVALVISGALCIRSEKFDQSIGTVLWAAGALLVGLEYRPDLPNDLTYFVLFGAFLAFGLLLSFVGFLLTADLEAVPDWLQIETFG